MQFSIGPLSIAVIGFLVFLFWNEIGAYFKMGALDVPLIAGSIIGVWLAMLGARWPRAVIFWAWVIFWVLRGYVFA
jgi:uncharacterized membrane protein YczE